MRLTFQYQPVGDLGAAAKYYSDLGWKEAWREGEHTIAFQMPDVQVQLMLDDAGDWGGAGPMYLVEDLSAWLRTNPDSPAEAITEIPGGRVAQIMGPGHIYYVFSMESPE